MQFTLSVSSLVFILPLLAQVSATPLTFKGGVAGNDKGSAASSSVVASAAASSAAATAASSVAATAASSAASSASSSAASSASSAAASSNSSDPQSSLTLDPKVIATGFENNGQDQPTAGQVASLTSSNNFINFCLTVPNLPITNGKQITTGSCNPAPMGIIAAQTNMPSSKFTFPTNGATIQENSPFTISMAIAHLDTGFFVNAEENYFAAPQQINSAGDVQGHSHVVVELLSSATQTTPTDPTKFAFFKGLNDPAANGVLTADVTSGLPAGSYRLASINTAANHQPVLVAVAQHGSMDDMVYFNVVANGTSASAGSAGSSSAAAATTSTQASSAAASSAAAASATASTSKNGQGNNNNNKGGNQGNNGKGGNNAAQPQQPQRGGPQGGNPFGKFKRTPLMKSRMH